MSFSSTLDRMHLRWVSWPLAQIFTAFTRCILALGFIPPSIPKILHRPFTSLPDENPVGHYFNALYGTGFYYDFIGWMQLLTAVLLLIPRTAHLGAFIQFPIMINIAVLTTAVGFKGTWLIAILMALAGLYLLLWEYDRIKPFLFYMRSNPATLLSKEKILLPLLFASGTALLLAFAISIGLANLHKVALIKLVPLLLGGAVFGGLVYWHHRGMR